MDQLSDVERLPQKRLSSEQSKIEERNNAYGTILTQLGVFRNKVAALKSGDVFSARTATVADTAVASASATNGAVHGSYTFSFSQLATAAKHVGTAGAGKALSTGADVSALTLSQAGFATAVTAGTFRVNGAQVDITTGESLKSVFDKISTATNGDVTATYNPRRGLPFIVWIDRAGTVVREREGFAISERGVVEQGIGQLVAGQPTS